jgi:threonine aldolase
MAADIVDKEAALFVPSGTMGNQIAVMTHTQRGDEIIIDESYHIFQHEVGAAALLSGVHIRTIKTECGIMQPEQVEAAIREDNIHFPQTGLICMENANSLGNVIPLDNMANIYKVARKHNIPVHLDGARLFNAANYLGVDAGQITANCDSVMFCLSKGLCAPVGSILAGDQDFIDSARKGRKLMGGGLRQAGFLAAAGLVALKEMRLRLDEDHQNALRLGQALAAIPGVTVCTDDIHINMVYFDIRGTGVDDHKLVEELNQNHILSNPSEGGLMRFATHHGIGEEEITSVINHMQRLLS